MGLEGHSPGSRDRTENEEGFPDTGYCLWADPNNLLSTATSTSQGITKAGPKQNLQEPQESETAIASIHSGDPGTFLVVKGGSW